MIAGKRVCVVMPAYNAEKTLKATLDDIPRDWVDDILLVDNMALAHARTPYRGERRVRVAMTEAVDGRELSL